MAVFQVTTLADTIDAADGVLSLREGIEAANARPGADTITFASSLAGETIVFEDDAVLAIADDLTIDGSPADGGADAITLTNGEYGRFTEFFVEGVAARFEDLTISGEGIVAENADVEVARTIITGSYYQGTGITLRGGTLDVADSTIVDNGGDEGGFGIFARGDVTITGSEIADNGGDYSGFGLEVEGTLTVRDSTIADNNGDIGDDGGSYGVVVDGMLTMINATVYGHTLTSNESRYANSAIGLTPGSTGVVTNSTIVGNPAALDDPSDRVPTVFGVPAGAELRLENSLVLNNGAADALPLTVEGTLTSNGGNVFGSPVVAGAASSDVLDADVFDVFGVTPFLDDNGGPTETLALLDNPANPAIGQAVLEDAPPADQRGFGRDADPDAGAFEAGAGGVSPPPPAETAGIDVRFVAADADFANTLGYYVRDAAGNLTGEAGILFPEVSDAALSPGDAAGVEGVLGDIGLFLIRDGADLGLDFDDGSVRVEDEKLVFEAADGTETKLQNYRVHFDFEDGQLQTSGGDDGAPTRYAWEDKASSEGSYDGDFDDAVFEVISFIEIPAPILPTDEGPLI